MAAGKREKIARLSRACGISTLLGVMPQRPQILIFNYHRIGDRDSTPFDPGVFSATTEEFDRQLDFFQRHFQPLTLEEVLCVARGELRLRRAGFLITFDDGYRDNYEEAFPILRRHDLQGVFFLPTSYVGVSAIPWWDEIAFILKSARRRSFRLEIPQTEEFDVDSAGLLPTLRRILFIYRQPAVTNGGEFIQALVDACGGERPDATDTCFMSWENASEMLRGGMAIGSHSHRHEVISKLTFEEQREDLAASRRILQERLGITPTVFAYPVGARNSFTADSFRALEETGYQAAFSFYGGFNLPGSIQRYDIRRWGVENDVSQDRLHMQALIGAVSGRFWL